MAQGSKDIISILREETIKEFREFDGQFRLIKVYQAITKAVHGESTLLTEYGYDGTSTRIAKKNESVVSWDSSWDI